MGARIKDSNRTIVAAMSPLTKWGTRSALWWFVALLIVPLALSRPQWWTKFTPELIPVVLGPIAAIWGIIEVLRSQRHLIYRCEYDGHTLRLRTFGTIGTQVRGLPQISDISVRRSRRDGQMAGHRIEFEDGMKVDLPASIKNSRELADRLQADRWPSRLGTL